MNNEIVMVITNDNIDSIKINLKSTFKKFQPRKDNPRMDFYDANSNHSNSTQSKKQKHKHKRYKLNTELRM